jgi:antitoxin ParD1/3/4
MNVLLKPDLEKFVAEKIKAGHFTNASDLINDALEVLREQETFTPQHEAYLREEVQMGIDQLDRGQTSEFSAETVIAEEQRAGED